MRPRYAERYWARRGTVFVAEDMSGTCIAAYPIGKEDARVRIGNKPIRIRWNVPPNRLKTVIFPGFAVKPDRDEPYVDCVLSVSVRNEGASGLFQGEIPQDSADRGSADLQPPGNLGFAHTGTM